MAPAPQTGCGGDGVRLHRPQGTSSRWQASGVTWGDLRSASPSRDRARDTCA